jgi:hypothetical protein
MIASSMLRGPVDVGRNRPFSTPTPPQEIWRFSHPETSRGLDGGVNRVPLCLSGCLTFHPKVVTLAVRVGLLSKSGGQGMAPTMREASRADCRRLDTSRSRDVAPTCQKSITTGRDVLPFVTRARLSVLTSSHLATAPFSAILCLEAQTHHCRYPLAGIGVLETSQGHQVDGGPQQALFLVQYADGALEHTPAMTRGQTCGRPRQ